MLRPPKTLDFSSRSNLFLSFADDGAFLAAKLVAIGVATATVGDIYYNTTANVYRFHNGTEFVDFGAAPGTHTIIRGADEGSANGTINENHHVFNLANSAANNATWSDIVVPLGWDGTTPPQLSLTGFTNTVGSVGLTYDLQWEIKFNKAAPTTGVANTSFEQTEQDIFVAPVLESIIFETNPIGIVDPGTLLPGERLNIKLTRFGSSGNDTRGGNLSGMFVKVVFQMSSHNYNS